MAADLQIVVEDKVSPALSAFLATMAPGGMLKIYRKAARAGLTAMQGYHRQFDAAGGWFNKALPTWGAGRSRTQWPRDVIRAWSVQGLSDDGFRLNNSHPHFNHKVSGGTITAKSWLTIPMVPEAHGRTTKQYERVTGNRLFRPRGRDILMARVNGTAQVIYALKRSVTHKAWPGALPHERVYLDPIIDEIQMEVIKALEEANDEA